MLNNITITSVLGAGAIDPEVGARAMGAGPASGAWMKLARAAAALTAASGLAALLGWALDIPLLTRVSPQWIPMAPSTALLFLLDGAGVLACTGGRPSRNALRVAESAGAVSTLLALALLLLSVRGIALPAEHLGLAISGTLNGKPLGHMSPLTALCFVLAGLSLTTSVLSSDGKPWLSSVAFGSASLVIFAGAVLALAYLYGVPVFYRGNFIPPALTTSLAFAALGIALAGAAAARTRASEVPQGAAWRLQVLILVLAIVTAGLVSAGYLYFAQRSQDLRVQAEARLAAVAKLKLSELAEYRHEALADGEVFHRNRVFGDLVRRALGPPGDAGARAALRSWLTAVASHFRYDLVAVLDARGVVRISEPTPGARVSSAIKHRAAQLLRTGEVGFQDFYRSEDDSRVHLAVLVPIFDSSSVRRPFATLVLRINPDRYLYPLLQRWPLPSASAETLLVRRDGDAVVFLNDLRFRKHAALSLRIPLTDSGLPAVKAVLGRQGIVNGTDYRGVPVIASVHAVAASPWFLVAERDTAEAFASGREVLWLATVLVAALVAGGGAAAVLLWRQQRREDLLQRARAAEALNAAAALRTEVEARRQAGEALERATHDLARSNAELEQFAYVASHDLQEPLRMVVGYVQLIEHRLGKNLDSETREFMDFAVDGAQRMQRLIQDILAYSRLSTRGQPLAAVDSSEALSEALAMLAGSIAESEAEVEAASLPVVRADRTQLVQLLHNLIGNAIKFRSERAPRIGVEARREPGRWRFSVTDNGIGIEPKYRERIFGIFQRLHTRREYPGTGIGLALCKRIVERHGGEIGVESPPEGGTVFWFTLPEEPTV